MGFRRRTRRRAIIAGAAIAHHEDKKAGEQQQADDQAPADDQQDQAPADDQQDQAQYAPPAADPADEIEHLAQLHTSGALTDDEFAAAKAKILGT
jgi:Short C-terminal domain